MSTVLVLAVATACSSGPAPHKSAPKPSPTSSPSPSASAASAPFRVSVTHVAGRLSRPRQAVLIRRVRATLTGYMNGAFLRSDYPRSDFDVAFRNFTSGAAHDARVDRALLTNRPLGESTTSVRAVH